MSETLKVTEAPDGYYRSNYNCWWVKVEGQKIYILQFGYDIGVSDSHLLYLKNHPNVQNMTVDPAPNIKFEKEWDDSKVQSFLTKEEEFELHKEEVLAQRQERRQIKEHYQIGDVACL